MSTHTSIGDRAATPPADARGPAPAGSDLDATAAADEIIGSLRATLLANVLGLPSIAVPVGLVDGQPQAVQIIGPRFGEALCLDAAETIERAIGPVTPIDYQQHSSPTAGHSRLRRPASQASDAAASGSDRKIGLSPTRPPAA